MGKSNQGYKNTENKVRELDQMRSKIDKLLDEEEELIKNQDEKLNQIRSEVDGLLKEEEELFKSTKWYSIRTMGSEFETIFTVHNGLTDSQEKLNQIKKAYENGNLFESEEDARKAIELLNGYNKTKVYKI